MRATKPRRTATIICGVEPELRAAVEAEATRRDASISSVVRTLIRAQLGMVQIGPSESVAR